MYTVYATYTDYDRRTGDKELEYDVFHAETEEEAEKLVEGLDKKHYHAFVIRKVK